MMNDFEKNGVISKNQLILPNKNQLKKGVAIIECIQNIPCNPCVDSCPVNAITMKDINALPKISYEKCIGCGKCVGICPGLAIFLIKLTDQNEAIITLPYEMLPLPKKGDIVEGLDRSGKKVDDVKVIKTRIVGKTNLITINTKQKYWNDIRNIRVNK